MNTILKHRRLTAFLMALCVMLTSVGVLPVSRAVVLAEASETSDGASDGTQETGGDTDTVPVESIKLDKTSKTIRVGKSFTLKATVLPEDASDKDIVWKCSNKYKAVVTDSGKVYGTYKGTVKITATTRDGSFTATCKVKVKKPKSTDSAAYSLYLMNKERKKKKIEPLILDTGLKKAAKLRAKELTKKMKQKRPNGKSFKTALDKYNVKYDNAAQNIAAGYTRYIYATYGWIGSKKNYKNITNKKYKKVYIARKVVSKGYRYYYVQLFTD